jgi:ribosome-associated protein
LALTTKRRTHILITDIKGQIDLPTLKDLVVQSLDDDKAFDIEVISLEEDRSSALADYIIVASGTSSTQTRRMAEKLRDRLSIRGLINIRIEGAAQGDWVVLDIGDIVVHLFKPEVREFYNIEKMWAMPTNTASQDGLQIA